MKKRQIMFLPEINSETFLLFFSKGESDYSYSLREYPSGGGIKVKYAKDFSRTASEMIKSAEMHFDAPTHRVNDEDFWRNEISKYNKQYLEKAKENFDYYQRLRQKLQRWMQSDEGKTNKWAKYILFAPDLFHLLCKLSFDKEVPAKDKVKMAAAIAYFISPIDLIPEGIVGPVGYVDDVALAAYVLNNVVNNTDPEILRKHWVGDEDILDVIKHILKVVDEMVGSGLWSKLKNRFS